jgi:hypothetical protein
MRFSKTIKLSKAKADKYFAEFIRYRDQDKPCVTCGRYKTEKDCGHFISRRFEAVRFDEKNANGQCIKCNRMEYGNQFEHAKAVDRMYGIGTADSLLMKSKMTCKRSQYDYEFISETFKNKLK